MKKITQTGIIPFNSFGLILKNYLRWFKVFITFYFVPMIVILTALIATSKEKLTLVLKNAVGFYTMAKTPFAPMMEQQLNESLNNLFHSPSFVAIFIMGFVLLFVCGSCLLVGFKHTFYEKVNLLAILKEGFGRLYELLWTLISLCLVIYLPMLIIGGIIYLISLLSLELAIILGITTLIAMVIFLQMVYFYVPMHFFSGNNPFSAAWCSFKTFWRNFFSLLGIDIIFGCLVLLSYIPILFILFLILKHYFPMLPKETFIAIGSNVFPPLIAILFPYLGGFAGFGIHCISTFIAYPELLEEDGSINLEIKKENATLPEQIQNTMPKQEDVSKPTQNEKPVSEESSKANQRPYLNQKIDQTEFDRLTDKKRL